MTLKHATTDHRSTLSRLIQSSLLATGLCLSLSSAQATEQDSGFYVGLSVPYFMTEDSGASSEEIGLGVLAGYSFSKYLSSEVSLFTLGDHEDLGLTGNGATLALLASYPVLEKLSLFVEGGAMAIDIDIDEALHISNTSSGEESLQSGVDSSLYFGIGAKYRFTDWSVTLKATAADLDADLNTVAAQVSYHF